MPERDDLIHGEELDQALKDTKGPTELGICETALSTRKEVFISGQVDEVLGDTFAEEIRAELMKAGAPFDDKTVEAVQLTTVVGGAFTYGIALGQATARLRPLNLIDAGGLTRHILDALELPADLPETTMQQMSIQSAIEGWLSTTCVDCGKRVGPEPPEGWREEPASGDHVQFRCPDCQAEGRR